jgi:hypothetical protein
LEKVNPYSYYEMARELIQLHGLADDVAAADALFPIANCQTRMNELLQDGAPVPLGVSKATAQAVLNALNGLWESFSVDDGEGGKKFEWPKEGVKIPSWKMNVYRHALEKFETVFSAEMSETATYFVPRRGIFYTPALVDTADETFPPDIKDDIPEKTKAEWRAAGRCLAFNLLSASGFHVARAVEGTMEAYYTTFVGQPPKEITWGKYLEDLEKADGPAEKTLAEIGQMKDDFRNPLMHPRVVLTEADAKILFGNGESLIITMAAEIKKKAGKG